MRLLLDVLGVWALVLLLGVGVRQGLAGLHVLGELTWLSVRDLGLPVAVALGVVAASRVLGWP